MLGNSGSFFKKNYSKRRQNYRLPCVKKFIGLVKHYPPHLPRRYDERLSEGDSGRKYWNQNLERNNQNRIK